MVFATKELCSETVPGPMSHGRAPACTDTTELYLRAPCSTAAPIGLHEARVDSLRNLDQACLGSKLLDCRTRGCHHPHPSCAPEVSASPARVGLGLCSRFGPRFAELAEHHSLNTGTHVAVKYILTPASVPSSWFISGT